MADKADIREPGVAEVRKELGISQSGLAALLGCSSRAVQSYEQGWRKPPDHVRKLLLMLLIVRRRGLARLHRPCWELTGCPKSTRSRCVVHRAGQDGFCWFLTGTLCHGERKQDWSEKWEACRQCKVMRRLLMKRRPRRDAGPRSNSS